MNVNGFEIERKYLIAMPEPELLAEASASRIAQTYLIGREGTTERVRARAFSDRTEYTHTTKRRVNAIRREELEETIGQAQYTELLRRADPARRTIEKTRYCLSWGEHVLEIDVFPFWEDYAILEVELEAEGQPVTLPPKIRVLREVTEDARYTNSAFSLEIPDPTAEDGTISCPASSQVLKG